MGRLFLLLTMVCMAVWIVLQTIVAAAVAGARESVAVEHAIVTAKRDARPELPDTLQNGNGKQPDVGAILGTALEQAAANSVVDMVLEHAPFGCPPCAQLDTTLKAIPGIRVAHTTGSAGPFPKLHYAGKVWHGALSRPQIEAILREYKPVRTVQAMTLGKLAIRKPVRDLLSRVIVSGGQTEIRFGSAAIILPSEMQQVVSFPLKGIAITFTGKKPRLRYGSGFLSLGADINSVVLTETQLVLGVAGVPDVALEITE